MKFTEREQSKVVKTELQVNQEWWVGEGRPPLCKELTRAEEIWGSTVPGNLKEKIIQETFCGNQTVSYLEFKVRN